LIPEVYFGGLCVLMVIIPNAFVLSRLRTAQEPGHKHSILSQRRVAEGFLLTDDGSTIKKLEQHGYYLTAKRKKLFNNMLDRLGIHMDRRALKVYTTQDNYEQAKENLAQAMVALNGMFPKA